MFAVATAAENSFSCSLFELHNFIEFLFRAEAAKILKWIFLSPEAHCLLCVRIVNVVLSCSIQKIDILCFSPKVTRVKKPVIQLANIHQKQLNRIVLSHKHNISSLSCFPTKFSLQFVYNRYHHFITEYLPCFHLHSY